MSRMRSRERGKTSTSSYTSSTVLTRDSGARFSVQNPQSPNAAFSFDAALLPTPSRSGGGGGPRRVNGGRLLSTSLIDSLADLTMSDAPAGTPAALSSQEEALRSSADRLSRRIRLTQAQETRHRTLVVEGAMEEFADILRRHAVYLDIAASCAVLQAARSAEEQQRGMQAQQWQRQITQDQLRDTVAAEEKQRRATEQAEVSVRGSLAQLQRAEVQPLQRREAFYRLTHAEHVRRGFLHREEARAVEAMGIPSFISLPCRHAPASASLGHDSDGRLDVKRGMAELNKLDLMARQRCPFRCAADCPYISQRTRQLGERWAAAVADAGDDGTRNNTRPATVSQCRDRRSVSRHSAARSTRPWKAAAAALGGISEVGKQRVRNVMMIEHYSTTTKFLPSLRL